ncbi:hypothetical protein TSUD_121510 [Trifolium subterraneum]|nr:hypothetical protein TSUD_121510 [Trifolium subterraneum]
MSIAAMEKYQIGITSDHAESERFTPMASSSINNDLFRVYAIRAISRIFFGDKLASQIEDREFVEIKDVREMKSKRVSFVN